MSYQYKYIIYYSKKYTSVRRNSFAAEVNLASQANPWLLNTLTSFFRGPMKQSFLRSSLICIDWEFQEHGERSTFIDNYHSNIFVQFGVSVLFCRYNISRVICKQHRCYLQFPLQTQKPFQQKILELSKQKFYFGCIGIDSDRMQATNFEYEF